MPMKINADEFEVHLRTCSGVDSFTTSRSRDAKQISTPLRQRDTPQYSKKPRKQRPLLPDVFVPPGMWTMGIRTKSLTNQRHGHWAARHRQAAAQVSEVTTILMATTDADTRARLREAGSYVVTMTRIGGQHLDDDNLASAFKSIRDAVAAFLGIDDGGECVRWIPREECGKRAAGGRVGVRLEIECL